MTAGSPNLAPNERRYPDEALAAITVSGAAKLLALDLLHESEPRRIYAIIQIHLDREVVSALGGGPPLREGW